MNPAFAATKRRLSDLFIEWERLHTAKRAIQMVSKSASIADENVAAWIMNAALSAGVSGLYSGMEEILRGVLAVVDGYVPSGERSSQDILDQASVGVDGTRPPVVSDKVYNALTDLKGFRYFERHNHRFRFDSTQVERNENLAESLVPNFVNDVEHFIERMSHQNTTAPGLKC